MISSCCLCNLARAAGQSTACPKLYNLQTLGKLGTGASNPELWGCDDSEDARTMRSRWKDTHLRPELNDLSRLPLWAFNNFNLFTALVSMSQLVWSQNPRACRPAGCQVLKYSAKAFPAPHTRSAPWTCGCCDVVMVWLVRHTVWCLVLDHSWNSLGRAVTSIVSGLLQLISTSRCGHMIWFVCTGHGEPRFRALSLSITPRPLK